MNNFKKFLLLLKNEFFPGIKTVRGNYDISKNIKSINMPTDKLWKARNIKYNFGQGKWIRLDHAVRYQVQHDTYNALKSFLGPKSGLKEDYLKLVDYNKKFNKEMFIRNITEFSENTVEKSITNAPKNNNLLIDVEQALYSDVTPVDKDTLQYYKEAQKYNKEIKKSNILNFEKRDPKILNLLKKYHKDVYDQSYYTKYELLKALDPAMRKDFNNLPVDEIISLFNPKFRHDLSLLKGQTAGSMVERKLPTYLNLVSTSNFIANNFTKLKNLVVPNYVSSPQQDELFEKAIPNIFTPQLIRKAKLYYDKLKEEALLQYSEVSPDFAKSHKLPELSAKDIENIILFKKVPKNIPTELLDKLAKSVYRSVESQEGIWVSPEGPLMQTSLESAKNSPINLTKQIENKYLQTFEVYGKPIITGRTDTGYYITPGEEYLKQKKLSKWRIPGKLYRTKEIERFQEIVNKKHIGALHILNINKQGKDYITIEGLDTNIEIPIPGTGIFENKIYREKGIPTTDYDKLMNELKALFETYNKSGDKYNLTKGLNKLQIESDIIAVKSYNPTEELFNRNKIHSYYDKSLMGISAVKARVKNAEYFNNAYSILNEAFVEPEKDKGLPVSLRIRSHAALGTAKNKKVIQEKARMFFKEFLNIDVNKKTPQEVSALFGNDPVNKLLYNIATGRMGPKDIPIKEIEQALFQTNVLFKPQSPGAIKKSIFNKIPVNIIHPFGEYLDPSRALNTQKANPVGLSNAPTGITPFGTNVLNKIRGNIFGPSYLGDNISLGTGGLVVYDVGNMGGGEISNKWLSNVEMVRNVWGKKFKIPNPDSKLFALHKIQTTLQELCTQDTINSQDVKGLLNSISKDMPTEATDAILTIKSLAKKLGDGTFNKKEYAEYVKKVMILLQNDPTLNITPEEFKASIDLTSETDPTKIKKLLKNAKKLRITNVDETKEGEIILNLQITSGLNKGTAAKVGVGGIKSELSAINMSTQEYALGVKNLAATVGIDSVKGRGKSAVLSGRYGLIINDIIKDKKLTNYEKLIMLNNVKQKINSQMFNDPEYLVFNSTLFKPKHLEEIFSAKNSKLTSGQNKMLISMFENLKNTPAGIFTINDKYYSSYGEALNLEDAGYKPGFDIRKTLKNQMKWMTETKNTLISRRQSKFTTMLRKFKFSELNSDIQTSISKHKHAIGEKIGSLSDIDFFNQHIKGKTSKGFSTLLAINTGIDTNFTTGDIGFINRLVRYQKKLNPKEYSEFAKQLLKKLPQQKSKLNQLNKKMILDPISYIYGLKKTNKGEIYKVIKFNEQLADVLSKNPSDKTVINKLYGFAEGKYKKYMFNILAHYNKIRKLGREKVKAFPHVFNIFDTVTGKETKSYSIGLNNINIFTETQFADAYFKFQNPGGLDMFNVTGKGSQLTLDIILRQRLVWEQMAKGDAKVLTSAKGYNNYMIEHLNKNSMVIMKLMNEINNYNQKGEIPPLNLHAKQEGIGHLIDIMDMNKMNAAPNKIKAGRLGGLNMFEVYNVLKGVQDINNTSITKGYIYINRKSIEGNIKNTIEKFTNRGFIQTIEGDNGYIFKVNVKSDNKDFYDVKAFIKSIVKSQKGKIIDKSSLQVSKENMSLAREAFLKVGNAEKLQAINLELNIGGKPVDLSFAFVVGEPFAKFIESNSRIGTDERIILNDYSKELWNLYYSLQELEFDPKNPILQREFITKRNSFIKEVNKSQAKGNILSKYNRAKLPGFIAKTVKPGISDSLKNNNVNELFTITTNFNTYFDSLYNDNPGELNKVLKKRGLFKGTGIKDLQELTSKSKGESNIIKKTLRDKLFTSQQKSCLYGHLIGRPQSGEEQSAFIKINFDSGTKTKALKMSPFLAALLGRDYDGDQMEIILPIFNEQQLNLQALYKAQLQQGSGFLSKSVHEAGSTVYNISTLYSKLQKGKNSSDIQLGGLFNKILKTIGTHQVNRIGRESLKNVIFDKEFLDIIKIPEDEIFIYTKHGLEITKKFEDALYNNKNQKEILKILRKNSGTWLSKMRGGPLSEGIPLDTSILPEKLKSKYGLTGKYPNVSLKSFFEIFEKYDNLTNVKVEAPAKSVINDIASGDIANNIMKYVPIGWFNKANSAHRIQFLKESMGNMGKDIVGQSAYNSEKTMLPLLISKFIGQDIKNEFFKNLPKDYAFKILKVYEALNENVGIAQAKHIGDIGDFIKEYKNLLSKRLGNSDITEDIKKKLFKNLGFSSRKASEDLFKKHTLFFENILSRISDVRHFGDGRSNNLFLNFGDKEINIDGNTAATIAGSFYDIMSKSSKKFTASTFFGLDPTGKPYSEAEGALKGIYNLFRETNIEKVEDYFSKLTGGGISTKELVRTREMLAQASQIQQIAHIPGTVSVSQGIRNFYAGGQGDIAKALAAATPKALREQFGFEEAETKTIKSLFKKGNIEDALKMVTDIQREQHVSFFNKMAFFGQKTLEKTLTSKAIPKSNTSLKSLLPYIAAGAVGLIAVNNLIGPKADTQRRIKSHMDLTRTQWSLFKKSRSINMGDETVFGKDKPYRLKKIYNVDINYSGGKLYV